MGNSQTTLKQPTKRRLQVIGGTGLILLGGLYFYRCYYKNEQDEINVNFVCTSAEGSHKQSGGRKESVIFGEYFGDRRHKVITDSDDGNMPMMQCIGRVMVTDTTLDLDNLTVAQKVKAQVSTGTVFRCMNGSFLVITCAHSISSKKSETDRLQIKKNVYFARTETFTGLETAPKYKKLYKMKDREVLQFSGRDVCPQDLAVIEFEDTDKIQFYHQILNQKKGKTIIDLIPAETLPKKQKLLYHIYGFPIADNQYAIEKGVQNGELWGMFAKTFTESKKDVMADYAGKQQTKHDQYVKLQIDAQTFSYNAIDTEGGQSGSAIFLYLQNRTYGIVGIHTCGAEEIGDKEKKENVGIALTGNKIKKLLKKWEHWEH